MTQTNGGDLIVSAAWDETDPNQPHWTAVVHYPDGSTSPATMIDGGPIVFPPAKSDALGVLAALDESYPRATIHVVAGPANATVASLWPARAEANQS